VNWNCLKRLRWEASVEAVETARTIDWLNGFDALERTAAETVVKAAATESAAETNAERASAESSALGTGLLSGEAHCHCCDEKNSY